MGAIGRVRMLPDSRRGLRPRLESASKLWRAAKSVNLAALRLWRRPAALKDFLRRVYSIGLSYRLPGLDAQEVLERGGASDFHIPIQYLKESSSSPGDLLALAALVRQKAPRSIFEIGTFEGLTASLLARNASPDVRVFTLDLPEPGGDLQRTMRSYDADSTRKSYQSGYLVDLTGCADRVTCLRGDSALFDFSPFEDSIDFFFIDGAHTEDYVRQDTLSAFRCLAPDGWVVWHDCLVPDVFHVLERLTSLVEIGWIRETNLALMRGKPEPSAMRRFEGWVA